MKYLKRFNESISEDELNRILDKISKHGIDSLTNQEREKLDKFDGDFKDDEVDDFWISKGCSTDINPKYLPGYKEPTEVPKVPESPKKTPITPKVPKKLISYISSNYNNFYVLNRDKYNEVLLEKYLKGVERVYYIVFNSLSDSSPVKALELRYNLNKQPKSFHDYSNMIIKDNNGNVITFRSIESLLMENGLNFGDFNNAWGYIEGNYNNR